jgi:hypothetical protein
VHFNHRPSVIGLLSRAGEERGRFAGFRVSGFFRGVFERFLAVFLGAFFFFAIANVRVIACLPLKRIGT